METKMEGWQKPWPDDKVGTGGHKVLLGPRMAGPNAKVTLDTIFHHAAIELPAQARMSIAFKSFVWDVAVEVDVEPEFADRRERTTDRYKRLAEAYKDKGGWPAVPWAELLSSRINRC